MKRTIAVCAISMLAALFPATTARGSIMAAEPPDFSDYSSSPTPLGSLELGINTILGATSGSDATYDWYDAFSFEADPGHEIIGIDLIVSNSSTNIPAVHSTLYYMPHTGIGGVNGSGDGTYSFDPSIFPLGTDSYMIKLETTTGRGFDYRFDISVADIPEPATLLLGLIGVGCVRRFTKRRTL